MNVQTRVAGVAPPARERDVVDLGRPFVHLAWFAGGIVLAFAAPYLLTSVVSLQHDVYYLMYFGAVLSFLYLYVRLTAAEVRAVFIRNWRWSLALGVAAAAFVVANVLSRDSTDGPSGGYLAFELAWRGAAYGAVDALLLTAFPGLVVVGLMRGRISGLLRRVGFAALALVLVMIITGVYHLGYEQFREEGIAAPETGNIIMSVPMLATLNPVGSVLAHASMHVAAEAHAHETDVFLPPQVETD